MRVLHLPPNHGEPIMTNSVYMHCCFDYVAIKGVGGMSQDATVILLNACVPMTCWCQGSGLVFGLAPLDTPSMCQIVLKLQTRLTAFMVSRACVAVRTAGWSAWYLYLVVDHNFNQMVTARSDAQRWMVTSEWQQLNESIQRLGWKLVQLLDLAAMNWMLLVHNDLQLEHRFPC